MLAHSYTKLLEPVELVFEAAIVPAYTVAAVPIRFGRWFAALFSNRQDLQTENERLKQENLIHRGQIQRMANLAAENLRLRLLLNATELFFRQSFGY